ncbi:HIRAN domain-containing protein [Pseudomonas sp. 2(2015)]|uniref:HIRAN domain-containing protein n=1 Tax=Pseudomonas sp. 2(2015) TaxID=1619950 RepID=UPI0009E4D2E8
MKDAKEQGAVYQLTVKGTGFNNPNGTSRAELIRRFVRDGMDVFLVPEPNNAHDPNAIAVYIAVKRWLFFGPYRYQIGYISERWAKSFTARFANGGTIVEAYVRSHFSPEDKTFPRVSIEAVASWPPRPERKPNTASHPA